MKETWSDIEGYEGMYQVSSLGNVRSMERDVPMLRIGNIPSLCHVKNRILKPSISNGGFLIVSLYRPGDRKRTKQVARLVAEAFVPNPNDYPNVLHRDGDTYNNTIGNVYWGIRGNPGSCKYTKRNVNRNQISS